MTINSRAYRDGGMDSNNRTLEVIEAKAEFDQSRPFQATVSLGIGRKPTIDSSSHLFGMIRYAIQSMTDTQRAHAQFEKQYADLKGLYFRFDAEGDLYKINLADYEEL
jgi:hypothetical protein